MVLTSLPPIKHLTLSGFWQKTAEFMSEYHALATADEEAAGLDFADWSPTSPAGATVRDLLTTLHDLGNPDAIAKFFLHEGVRGRRSDSRNCPIQKWLREVTGHDYAVVPHAVVAGHKIVSVLPRPAEEFMTRFDGGSYPELELPRRRRGIEVS
jgi:hypothetical protein